MWLAPNAGPEGSFGALVKRNALIDSVVHFSNAPARSHDWGNANRALFEKKYGPAE